MRGAGTPRRRLLAPHSAPGVCATIASHAGEHSTHQKRFRRLSTPARHLPQPAERRPVHGEGTKGAGGVTNGPSYLSSSARIFVSKRGSTFPPLRTATFRRVRGSSSLRYR